MGGIFVFSQKSVLVWRINYMVFGDGEFPPLPVLSSFFFFFFLLFFVLVAGLIMKSTPRQIKGEKKKQILIHTCQNR